MWTKTSWRIRTRSFLKIHCKISTPRVGALEGGILNLLVFLSLMDSMQKDYGGRGVDDIMMEILKVPNPCPDCCELFS